MTREEFSQIVTMIEAAWPRQPLSRDTRALLAQFMKPLAAEDVRAAVMKLIATQTFTPSIAEILKALENPKAVKGGFEAWGEVSIAVRRVGRYGDPEFKDPVLARCVELFGWQNICDSTNEEADRAHFARLYDAITRRGDIEITPTDRRMTGGGALLALTAGIGNGGSKTIQATGTEGASDHGEA